MKLKRWVAAAVAAGALGLAGVAAAPAQSGVPSEDMNKGLAPEVEKPMELTDAQVKGFFDATDELRSVGSATPPANSRGSSPANFAKSLEMNEQSLGIIKKHGFKDATEFQRVGYNAAMAYNVLQQGGKAAVNAKLDKAAAQQQVTIEKLRKQLTPEQFELLKTQAGKALQTARTMQDVPDGNLEIMKKYEGRMKSFGKH